MHPDAAEQVAAVRRFYDANTRRFRRRGDGGDAIHRAVWAPGTTSREQAFRHVERVILDVIAERPSPRVVDLGCGVGASLVYLARARADLTGEGVTISAAQVADATHLIDAAGLGARLRVREGDFRWPPRDCADADIAFSIEAFVHGPDPAAYFRSAAALLAPGGLLVLCDDFLAARGGSVTGVEGRWLEDFRNGWRVGSLIEVADAVGHATAAGLTLVRDDDLTPYLELRRPRDRAVRTLATVAKPLMRRGQYLSSLVGGDAVQRCLVARLVTYRLLAFERSCPETGDVGSCPASNVR